ncbi:MAG: TetR family transcriptional regulator [Bacteroidia bacterium]|nr:TetR family transcriptional regulator [Bacteroidia bacterium]
MKRDREQTEQLLIDAVGAIVREAGIDAVGINSVAREAGVDKVLIYRYFGDINGLLAAWVARQDYFSRLQELIGEGSDARSRDAVLGIAQRVLIGQLRSVVGNRELLEVFRWELGTRNAVTDEIARRREAQGSAITKVFERAVDDASVDVRAMVTLLSAGINYLALRAQTVDEYNGIPLTGKRGWKRLENAIASLLDIIGEKAFRGESAKDIA